MNQESLFSDELSRKARDEAIERVDDAAADRWKEDAWQLILRLSAAGAPFTTDDLWRAGLAMPREPRALGPMMLRAVRHKVCAPTGVYADSNHVASHGRPKRQYLGVAR
jgi:hypothetical protein